MLRWMYWTYDQLPWLHRLRLTKGWGDGLIRRMRNLRRQEVCLLVKTDEVRAPKSRVKFTKTVAEDQQFVQHDSLRPA